MHNGIWNVTDEQDAVKYHNTELRQTANGSATADERMLPVTPLRARRSESYRYGQTDRVMLLSHPGRRQAHYCFGRTLEDSSASRSTII